MGALAISDANLSTLETNLNVLNNSINNVSEDVININGRIDEVDMNVNSVRNSVNSLEMEIRNLMREIKGNTLVSNAQNDILIKQNKLAHDYGYYDEVRKQAFGLLQNFDKGTISKSTVIKLKDSIVVNTPNYYLSYAVASICYWLLNDKDNANIYLNKALRLNESKTCLLMALVYLRLRRNNTALKWIKKYLSIQKPTEVSNDFICVLEALANDSYNSTITKEIYDSIIKWSNTLNNEKDLYNENLKRWNDFFYKDIERVDSNEFILLGKFTDGQDKVLRNVGVARSYQKIYDKFDDLFHNTKVQKQKTVDELLNSLINNFEKEELSLKKDILKDQFIIDNQGDSFEADKLFEASKLSYEKETDLYTLLTSTVLDRNDVSPLTRKLAVSLLKNVISDSFNKIVGVLNNDATININIDEWTGVTINGSNEKVLLESLLKHASKPYDDKIKEKSYINTKTVLSGALLIAGIGLAIYYFYFGAALMVVALMLGFYFTMEVMKYKAGVLKEKNDALVIYEKALLTIISEIVDAYFIGERSKKKRQEVLDYINSFNSDNYINKRGEYHGE